MVQRGIQGVLGGEWVIEMGCIMEQVTESNRGDIT